MTNEKRIKIFINCAAISAFIAGFITLSIMFTGMYTFTLFNLSDVALLIGLGFGVLKKAEVMPLYYLFITF